MFAPVQIVNADICRDGGTYVMEISTRDGRRLEVELPVRLDRNFEVAGYDRPTVLDYADTDHENRHPVEWDLALELASALQPLINDQIGWGGRARATEMLAFMYAKGDIASGFDLIANSHKSDDRGNTDGDG